MTRDQAIEVMDTIAGEGVIAVVGAEPQPVGDPTYAVMVPPGQVIEVVPLALALNARGYRLYFGPRVTENGEPTGEETWRIDPPLESLPVEAEEVVGDVCSACGSRGSHLFGCPLGIAANASSARQAARQGGWVGG